MIASRWQDAWQLTGALNVCCAWSCDDALGSLADKYDADITLCSLSSSAHKLYIKLSHHRYHAQESSCPLQLLVPTTLC